MSYGIYSGGAIANTFKISSGNNGNDEQLEAIGLGIFDTGVTYSVQIYKNPADKSNPRSGTKLLSVPLQGQIACAGYYTIPLTAPVRLAQGDTFSVVITLSDNNDGIVYYFVDEEDKDDQVHFVSEVHPLESLYQMRSTSIAWRDHYYEHAVARVKAYTTDTAFCSPQSISVNRNTLSMTAGENAILTATILPANTTDKRIIWKSSDEKVVTVTETGAVLAKGSGKAVITATSCADGSLYTTCSVTVKPKKMTGLSLKALKGRKVKVKWKKQSDVSGYEICWSAKKKKGYNSCIRVAKAGKTSYTKKKLKARKQYYFKVRAYKTISGKRLYGEYSTPKRIKVKA